MPQAVSPRVPTITIIGPGSKGKSELCTHCGRFWRTGGTGQCSLRVERCRTAAKNHATSQNAIILMCVSLRTWPSFCSERRFQQSIHELQPFFVDRAPSERVPGENSQPKIAAGSAEHHLDFLAKLLWNRAFFLEPFEQFEHVRR